jgi:hypothetical protein
LPPEGKAEISVDLEGNTNLKIKSFSPAVNGICSLNRLKVGISSRFAYWGRYGLGVGINLCCSCNNNNYNTVKPFLSVDRRISDFVPFMRNTTVGIVYDGDFVIELSVFF